MKTNDNHSKDLEFINKTLDDLKQNINKIDFASYKEYGMDDYTVYSLEFYPIIQEFKIGKNSYRIEKAKNTHGVFTYQIVINGKKDKAIQLYEEQGDFLRVGDKQFQDQSAAEIFKNFKNCLDKIEEKISDHIDKQSNCTIDRNFSKYKIEQHNIRADFRKRYNDTSYTDNKDGTFKVTIGDNEYTTAFMHFQPTYKDLYINEDYSWETPDDIVANIHKKKSATMFSSNNKKNIFTTIHSIEPFSVAMMFGPKNDIYDYSHYGLHLGVEKQEQLTKDMKANYLVLQLEGEADNIHRTLYFKMVNDALKNHKDIDKFRALFANTEVRDKQLFSIKFLDEEQKEIQNKKNEIQKKEKKVEEYLEDNKNPEETKENKEKIKLSNELSKEIKSIQEEKQQIELDEKAIESAIVNLNNLNNNGMLNSGTHFCVDEALMITKKSEKHFDIANFCIQFNFYNDFDWFREIYKINKEKPMVKWENIEEEIKKIVKHNNDLKNNDLWILDYGNWPNTFFKIPNDIDAVKVYYKYRYDLVEKERQDKRKILEPFDPEKNIEIKKIREKQSQQNDSKNITTGETKKESYKIDNKIDNKEEKKEECVKEKIIIGEKKVENITNKNKKIVEVSKDKDPKNVKKNKAKNIDNYKLKPETEQKINSAIERIQQKINSVDIDDNKLFIISGEHGYKVFSEFLKDPKNADTIDLALKDINKIKEDKQLGFLIPENTFKPGELEGLFTSAEKIRDFLLDKKQDTYKKEILLYNLATIAQNLKGTDAFYPEYVDQEDGNYYCYDNYDKTEKIKIKKYIADFLAHSQYFVTLFPKRNIYMKDTDRGKEYDKKDGKKNGENKLTKDCVEGDIVDLNNFLDRGKIGFEGKYGLTLIDHYISNCEAIMMIAYKRAKELAEKSKNGEKVHTKIDIIYPNVGIFASKDKEKAKEHKAIIDLIYKTYAAKLNKVLEKEKIGIKVNVVKTRIDNKIPYSFEKNKETTSFIYINPGDPFVHIGAEALWYVEHGYYYSFTTSNDTYMTLTTSLDMLGCKNENEDKLGQLKGFYYVDRKLKEHIKLNPKACKFCIIKNTLSVEKEEKKEKEQQKPTEKKIKKLKLKKEDKKIIIDAKKTEDKNKEKKEEPKQKLAQLKPINIKSNNKFKLENKTNNLKELIQNSNTKEETVGKNINFNNFINFNAGTNNMINPPKNGFNEKIKLDNNTIFPKIISNNNIDLNNNKNIINNNVINVGYLNEINQSNNAGKTKLNFHQQKPNQNNDKINEFFLKSNNGNNQYNKLSESKMNFNHHHNVNINKPNETGNKSYLPHINDKNSNPQKNIYPNNNYNYNFNKNSNKKIKEIIISKDKNPLNINNVNNVKNNNLGKNYNGNININKFNDIFNNQLKPGNNNNYIQYNNLGKSKWNFFNNHDGNLYSNNQFKPGDNNYSKIKIKLGPIKGLNKK